jgi:hypothetical protein
VTGRVPTRGQALGSFDSKGLAVGIYGFVRFDSRTGSNGSGPLSLPPKVAFDFVELQAKTNEPEDGWSIYRRLAGDSGCKIERLRREDLLSRLWRKAPTGSGPGALRPPEPPEDIWNQVKAPGVGDRWCSCTSRDARANGDQENQMSNCMGQASSGWQAISIPRGASEASAQASWETSDPLLVKPASAASVPLPSIWLSISSRVFRATRLPTDERLEAPLSKSPSQWPGIRRASISAGR